MKGEALPHARGRAFDRIRTLPKEEAPPARSKAPPFFGREAHASHEANRKGKRNVLAQHVRPSAGHMPLAHPPMPFACATRSLQRPASRCVRLQDTRCLANAFRKHPSHALATKDDREAELRRVSENNRASKPSRMTL